MINKIFNWQTKSVGAAALIVGLANVVSRLLGIWRDRILAGSFGVGDNLDIYYAAFRIPDFIFTMLVVGGLSASFIPIFLEYRARDEKIGGSSAATWALASNVLNLTMFAVFLCALAAAFFMPVLMKIVTPGFDPKKLGLTVNLSRLILLSPIFLTASNIIGGILQSFKKFLVFSLSSIFYNLGIIFGAIFLVESCGIYGLGLGVILGAFFHFAIQLPALRSCGFRYTRVFDFRHAAVRQIIKLMVPRTLGMGALQVNWIIMTALASTLASGSLAIFNLANNFQGFLVGLFGVALATAAFPTLSELGAKKDYVRFAKTYFSSFRQILFFTLPTSIILIVLANPIIRLILETGFFRQSATAATAATLQIFSLSIFSQAVVLLMVRAFFALKNTLLPFLAAVFTVAINVILALFFLKPFGIQGLALAYAAASFFNLAILWFFLKRITPKEFSDRFSAAPLVKIVVSSIAAGIGSWFIFSLGLYRDPTELGTFIQVAIAGSVGIGIFIIISLVLKSEEMTAAGAIIRKRLIGAQLPPTADDVDGSLS